MMSTRTKGSKFPLGASNLSDARSYALDALRAVNHSHFPLIRHAGGPIWYGISQTKDGYFVLKRAVVNIKWTKGFTLGFFNSYKRAYAEFRDCFRHEGVLDLE